FTASGSRALERAVAIASLARPGPLVLSRLEHPSLLRLAEREAAQGREVRYLPAPRGSVEIETARSLFEGASVVILSALNHELGTALPIAQLREHLRDAVLVVDAVQAAPWLDLVALRDGQTLLVCASQKLGGPPGAAALVVPRELWGREPPVDEDAGLLSVVGFGDACALARAERAARLERAVERAGALLTELERVGAEVVVNGADPLRAGPILNLSFPGIHGADLAAALDLEGVCIARGSACIRVGPEGSPVVLAAYPDAPWRAVSATRWSLGFDTTSAEIERAVAVLGTVLPKLPRRVPWPDEKGRP
ncbi:MAG: aminotransferase class V-fold PLP-dependent enzyme, partial [Pseudomonadota bacterium]